MKHKIAVVFLISAQILLARPVLSQTTNSFQISLSSLYETLFDIFDLTQERIDDLRTFPANHEMLNQFQEIPEYVENSNGYFDGSIRQSMPDSRHTDQNNYFFGVAPSSTGHRYFSLNSLGFSSLTSAQVINYIKANPDTIFPINAEGECGEELVLGNIYSLSFPPGIGPANNPVQVTAIGAYYFIFNTLPGHNLRGLAVHGIVKDKTGELWLFQYGQGEPDENPLQQEWNNVIAQIMWQDMAYRIKDKIAAGEINSSSTEPFVNNSVITCSLQ